MPGPIEDFTTFTSTPAVTIEIEPIHNIFYSMLLLAKAEKASIGGWVRQTFEQMTQGERYTHRLVMFGLHYAVTPTLAWSSFPAYLKHLSTIDPNELVDKLLDAYACFPLHEDFCAVPNETPQPYDKQAILASPDTYLEFLCTHFNSDHIDNPLEKRAYEYVVNPPAMQELIVAHLRHIWEQYLAKEWQRVRPMLEDAAWAFRQLDLNGKSNLEIAKLMTDQSLEDTCWEKALTQAEQITFIPNAHIGPYIGRMNVGKRIMVCFGARLPKGMNLYAPDLSRTEILVRLSALADDSRLRILKYISENGEQRSQDIMHALDFSQSAASRHLKQLSATGFLTERRCEGAKCYHLNTERVEETVQATNSFLLGQEASIFAPQIHTLTKVDSLVG
ncbi:ArsR/SmtB family transcription factor [Chloroflexota bacterium]